MMIVSPLTPGQVSFFLGVIPVIVAWTYAEILEHRKSLIPSKVHSDINLVELGNETVKEDDRALLLEGGGLQSASSNARTPTATSPILSNLRQLRNLEKALGGDVRVCDRTALILDIFNQRAATHEASLQVALAQLEYQLRHGLLKCGLTLSVSPEVK